MEKMLLSNEVYLERVATPRIRNLKKIKIYQKDEAIKHQTWHSIFEKILISFSLRKTLLSNEVYLERVATPRIRNLKKIKIYQKDEAIKIPAYQKGGYFKFTN